MKSIACFLALLSVVLSVSSLKGENYFYFTDYESSLTFPGDIVPIFNRDTIWGPARTNECFRFSSDFHIPFAPIYMSRDWFPWPFETPIPDNIHYNVPQIVLPELLTYIREGAQTLSIPGQEWRCSIRGWNAILYYYEEGTFFDSLSAQSIRIPLSPRAVVFVDGKLEIEGEMSPQDCEFIIGCSRDITLVDNVMLEGTNMTNGTLPAGATSKIAIASEHGIYIGNTIANGRENCGGDHSNNNHDHCHIIITAYVVALGTQFQFEQMNDVFDWYIGPTPDERGNIVLTGGVAQRWRGYVHRSNHNGTGYNKVYHWDNRLTNWSIGVFEPFIVESIPDSFYFDDTPVGTTGFDTVVVTGAGPYSGAYATYPFAAATGYEYSGPTHRIPVTFTPPGVGPYSGALTFYLDAHAHVVRLYGNGIQSAPPLTTKVFPNPFNNISTLRLTLPQSSHVRAVVYDILGREVAKLADETFPAGQTVLSIDGANWSSGVYFLSLRTEDQVSTQKLLLLK